MPTESISYIGATFAISVATPTAITKTAYQLLTYLPIGKVASHGPLGESSADIQVDLLEGIIEHVNGAKDLGEIEVAVRHNADADDTGQTAVRAQSNTNTNCSFRLIDPDGAYIYYQGKVANYMDNERISGNYKGATFVVRGKGGSKLVTTV